jgi:hypothetical protein
VTSARVIGNGASPGTPGASPDDIGFAVALASIAPVQQFAASTTLPETFWNANLRLAVPGLAPDGISDPVLDSTKVSSGGADRLIGPAGRDVFFGRHGLDKRDWDDLPETFAEL